VIEIDRRTGKIVVEHVMMMKRHTKAEPAKQIKRWNRGAGEPDPRLERKEAEKE